METSSMHEATVDAEPDNSLKALWRNRGFRGLLLSHGVSQLGSAVTTIAVPLLAVLQLNATAADLGILVAAGIAPDVLLRLPAGAWADRVARRIPVLVICDLARAALLLLIPLLAIVDSLSMAALIGIVSASGAFKCVFGAFLGPTVPRVVGREHVVRANGTASSVTSVCEVAGPGIGGVLVQAITAPFAILVDAISFVASALLLRGVRETSLVTDSASAAPKLRLGLTDLFVYGVQTIFRDRSLRIPFITAPFLAAAGSMIMAILVLYASVDLQLPPAQIGLFLGAGAIGAFAAGMTVANLNRKFTVRQIQVGSTVLMALSVFGLALGQPGITGGVAILTYELLGSYGAATFMITVGSALQTTAPSGSLGRVLAAFSVLTAGFSVLGALLAGLIATWAGTVTAIVTSGALLAAIAVVAACSGRRLHQDSAESPAGDSAESAGRPAQETT